LETITKNKHRYLQIVPYLLVAVLAFLIILALIYVAGRNPINGIYYIVVYPLTNSFGFTETLVKMTPILLTSLGCLIAFRAGLWNIGAEGQLYMGAVMAAWLGTVAGILPVVHILLVTIASFVIGGAYALIPAFLKVKKNINEVLTTIILNYVAFWLAHYIIHWPPLRDPTAANPQTYPILASASLPLLIPQTRLHAGIFLALISTVIIYFILERSKLGYEINMTGSNMQAAMYGGINVKQIIMVSMLISGGLAGLAGMVEVVGLHGYLLDNISQGYGFVAVLVALLGAKNVIGVILAAFFASILYNGADIMQIYLATPKEIADTIVSVTMLLMISRKLLYRVRT